jgi:hypothetical protein
VDPPDERARVLSTLREAGYQAYAAADPSDAMERLRFTPHAAAVIRDGFGGAGDRSPLMDSLAEMGMALRRTLCVVLVSDVTPALDPMVAFAHSVDLVIHPKDLAHLSDALQRCQENAERKYGVLQQALRAAGKA